jgi:hypothetical protein
LLDYDDDVEETHSAEKKPTSSIDIFHDAIPEQQLPDQMNRNERLTFCESVENNDADEPPGEVPALDASVNKEDSQLHSILIAPTFDDISD